VTLTREADPDTAEIHIVLATPQTVDALCAPILTGGRLSCRHGRDVVTNAWRWSKAQMPTPDSWQVPDLCRQR
jgi:hypothetical protein